MSRNYKKRKNKTYDNLFNIILTVVILFVLTPVIPITIGIMLVLYFTKLKGKYAFVFGLVGLGVLFFCFSDSVFSVFSSEFGRVLSAFGGNIVKGQIFSPLNTFGMYTGFSYIVITFISIALSGFFIKQMERNENYKNAGIDTVDERIKKTNETNKNTMKNTMVQMDKIENKEATLLGTNRSRKKVYCQDNAKHVFVSGTTGSGKTVLLANFMKSAISKNYGLLLVDGKGDTGSGSMLEITQKFCEEHHRKLYIVDMNNPETSTKYNPFQHANATMAKDMLINMSDWSEEHYKTNTERYLQRLIKLLLKNNVVLSFNSIIQSMSVKNFTELSIKLLKEEKISKEEHNQNLEIIKSSANIAGGAQSRFSTIAESQIGNIFDNNGIDIYQALREKAVILFILNPLIYPEMSSAFGRLILIDSKKAVSKMFNNSDRKFFIFDEINVYVSSVLVDLINKSRSAGITCIAATQSLADLQTVTGDKLKDQIIENCNNYVVLRQNSFSSAEEWAKTLGTKETMKMTYQISSDSENTDKGSARPVREYIVHPDEIKAQKTGEGVFLSRDIGKCERIQVHKPF